MNFFIGIKRISEKYFVFSTIVSNIFLDWSGTITCNNRKIMQLLNWESKIFSRQVTKEIKEGDL